MAPVISRAGFILAAIAGCGPAAATSAACKDYTKQYDDYDDTKKFGATDKDGDGCTFYADHADECGKHDVEDFIANEMCCSCGGGSTSTVDRSIAINNAKVAVSQQGQECPDGLEPITTITACRASMDMLAFAGWDWKGDETDADWPEGCYYCKSSDCPNGVYFNKAEGGTSRAGTQRICHKRYDPASVKILFVGDSDVDHWDSAPGFPGSFNVGIGGYTTRDVAKEVDDWVNDVDPEWVVIVCGENDISGKPPQTNKALERFKTIVGKFIADGARVIYMGTKPEPDSRKLHTEYKHYDEEVRKFARSLAQDDSQKLPPLQMIDVFVSFTSATDLYASDKLHMSRLGYQFWNAWVKLAMNSQGTCFRWRDGVCMEATEDPKPSGDLLRRFREGHLSLADVGAWKLSGVFLLVAVVGVASAAILMKARRREASVLPQYEETGLLNVD